MRKTNIWFLNLLFFTGIGLGSCNQADKDSKYITVNVNENYPEKELVLQDFMDVEYIPLETTDEFITQGA
ncbi:6-bladed beta-propeller, partial [Phocaeicola coprophilus]